MSYSTYQEATQEQFKRLAVFVPVVARVHGQHHPEFYDVQQVFQRMSEKVKELSSTKPMLDEEFHELRQITNQYSVPNDVCESYEAVYKMLSDIDQLYFG